MNDLADKAKKNAMWLPSREESQACLELIASSGFFVEMVETKRTIDFWPNVGVGNASVLH